MGLERSLRITTQALKSAVSMLGCNLSSLNKQNPCLPGDLYLGPTLQILGEQMQLTIVLVLSNNSKSKQT